MTGKTYYVSGTGNDSNDGLKEGSAFRTLQKAANLVQAGDTVYVMNGTYEQTRSAVSPVLGINQKHGTASAPITFAALGGHNPVIKSSNFQAINIVGSSYIVIEGLTVVGANDKITLKYAQSQKDNLNNPLTNGAGIYIQPDQKNQSSHHITIRGNTISKFPSGGIASKEADYITIEKNIVSETCWYSPWGANAISTLRNRNLDDNTTDYKIIIRDNVSYNNYTYIPWWESSTGKATEGHGIMIDAASSLGLDNAAYKGKILIANNTSYNNGGAGIQVFNSSNADVINNTTYQNSLHPDLAGVGEILISGASANVNVVNNIMYARSGAYSYIVGGSAKNIKADHNLIYNTDKYNKTGTDFIVGKDPQFVNAAAGNFALNPESVAIDAGDNIFNSKTGNIPDDGNGNGIGVIDIGAYEVPSIKTPTSSIQVRKGTEGSEYLKGNAPVNKIYGQGGQDAIAGNQGNDQLWGGSGQDTLWGGNGEDVLYGDSGNDFLWGNNDNYTLVGGIGNDFLYGRAGNDWLNGGKGNDVLTGGYGIDTFVLALGEGSDSIVDFELGKDKIALSSGLGFGQLLIQQTGTQTSILNSVDRQVLAQLDNVSASTLLAEASTTFIS
ncbi:hypothetical protein [Nostoc sp. 2RC]|uniref:hypothetical protein n=1 Tax=Nostoc sp. 2RC TaxID=2485484 RepID=UPI0016283A71|nr:hypothetical protein [Nostoc sp. 2RC]MBC1237734.1 hypothetical protein [Nostoc sp. 2RC]